MGFEFQTIKTQHGLIVLNPLSSNIFIPNQNIQRQIFKSICDTIITEIFWGVFLNSRFKLRRNHTFYFRRKSPRKKIS